MKPVQKLLAVAAAGLLGAVLVPRITDAQVPGRPESALTITEPTEIPGGVVLQPGNYTVRVAESKSNWNVIAFDKADTRATVATVLATPHTAKDAIPNTTFVYFNTPEGQPKVLRSWFPPNDRYGQDFIYPKERAEQLAKMTTEKIPEETTAMKESVNETGTTTSPSTQDNTIASTETSRSTDVDNTTTTDTTAQNNTGSTWRTDTGASTTTTESTPAPETTTAENETGTTQRQLPRTASPLPLLALSGLSALGLGLAVRRYAA